MKSNGPFLINITVSLLLGLFAIAGCYTESNLSTQIGAAYPALPDSTMFVLLPKVATAHIDGVKIGKVIYNEGLLSTISWTHDRIIDNLRSTALQHGANLAKATVYVHKTQRTSEYISADLYLVREIQRYNYEDEIEWPSHRTLSFDDFKFSGPILSDPSIGQSKGTYELGTIAKFRCQTSWINRTSRDSVALLLHEQGLFDLCEIYCRQYRDWIRKGNPQEPFFGKMNKAWMEKRSQYEWQTRHGLDFARQAEWTARINDALLFGSGGSDAEFEVH
ncbi:MAG TPA: hypothetical protein VKQ52_07740 [Puia sp.]|nr:hypothetical protein [Puia sp.]